MLGWIRSVWSYSIQPQLINNSGEAFHSLVNTLRLVWEVSCHVIHIALGYIFYISTIQDGWEEPGLSKSDDRGKGFLKEVLPCDKSVTRYVCFFGGIFRRLTLRCWEGKEKCCAFHPLLPKICAEKLLGVRPEERQTCITTTRWHAVTQVDSVAVVGVGDRCLQLFFYFFFFLMGTSLAGKLGSFSPIFAHR